MKMCFTLCDANAVNEKRALVRDTQEKLFLRRMQKRTKTEITNMASLMGFCSEVGSSWLAVNLQPVSSLPLLERDKTQEEDKEMQASAGGR